MMKKNRLFGMMLLSAATALLTSCTNDLTDERQGEVPITLTTAVIESQDPMATRADADVQSTQLPSGATFVAEFSGDDVSVSSAIYTADGSGGAITTMQPCFTLSSSASSSTTVHAYCPSKASGTFSVQANQSTDDAYKASDLMYATADIHKSSPTGALTFAHKMAKIIVNATVGDGISSITAVKIVGGSRTVNITDATTCTLGTTLTDALSASSPITVWTGSQTSGTLSCAALIPPQTVTNSDFLVITADGEDFIYNVDSKAFATGLSYTFNVTITGWASRKIRTVPLRDTK